MSIKKLNVSSSSMRRVKNAGSEIHKTHGTPAISSVVLAAPEELVLTGSSGHRDELYNSEAFQLAWANEIAFHVAEHVIHLRRLREYSQAKVAQLMGTSQSKIARIESGDDNITLATLSRLVDALDGRLCFAIEPKEYKFPRWERNWWDMIGDGLGSNGVWQQKHAISYQHGESWQLLSGWSSQNTLVPPATVLSTSCELVQTERV